MDTTISIDVATTDLGAVATEHLEAMICQGAANLTSAERDWLLTVAEFDRRRGWAAWGSRSCAAWLSWQAGLDIRAAREKVRVAHALVRFPSVSEAMAGGELSYAKVRAITRIIEPETETALVNMALAGTTNHVERIVSAYRRHELVTCDRERSQRRRRGLHRETETDGSVVITIRVPAEQSVEVLTAIEQHMAPPGVLDENGDPIPLAQRRVDALVTLVTAGAAAIDEDRAVAPRALATVHIGAEVLFGEAENGRCDVGADTDAVDQPVGISREAALRMICDADVEAIILSGEGDLLRMGRRTRSVRGRLARAVKVRDGGCRFPGCTVRGRLQVHHIKHWVDGGFTDEDNLVCLCEFHHHFLHEGGWWLEVRGDHMIVCAPDGRRIAANPPAVRGHRASVDARGRSARHGRCQWRGERLDMDSALIALASRRAARHGAEDQVDAGPFVDVGDAADSSG